VPAGLGTVTQVSAGIWHTCAIRSDGTLACWGHNGNGQTNVPAIPTTTVYPTATFSVPGSVVAGQPFTLALTGAQVPGYSGTVSFSYAFDCGDGSGYGAFGASHSVSCPTSAASPRSVRGTVKDHEGDATEYTGTVDVTEAPSGFTFSGFFAPVENLPTVNMAKAGSAIPVKFSLGGNQTLNIFESGSPTAPAVPCTTGAPVDNVAEVVNAGGSSLSYDAATQRYTYVWKTDKAWANSCRTLTLKFIDGSTQTASFKFKK
jgi:hypothetical protein